MKDKQTFEREMSLKSLQVTLEGEEVHRETRDAYTREVKYG